MTALQFVLCALAFFGSGALAERWRSMRARGHQPLSIDRALERSNERAQRTQRHQLRASIPTLRLVDTRASLDHQDFDNEETR